MEWLSENWQDIMGIATSVVGAFAIISTMNPNPSDDKAVNQLYKLINFLGANFGKSRNEGDE